MAIYIGVFSITFDLLMKVILKNFSIRSRLIFR
jgi:hypothetical protein